ncbi:required for meiotic nuclear division protein 1 homolog isoform X2 [Centruroides sculpturatus]|uniref:required for meiotic nuclear division protein 1 homolog isoform X2 n=1 Tax=Centruroides sculpturatus TaxID=218467 RepID=UPI000C6D3467|nr:required for meiotic nuclear division protein 1 homolog isoform X2 [Centruroides sculpturatus]
MAVYVRKIVFTLKNSVVRQTFISKTMPNSSRGIRQLSISSCTQCSKIQTFNHFGIKLKNSESEITRHCLVNSFMSQRFFSTPAKERIQQTLPTLHPKKRITRKKPKLMDEEIINKDEWTVVALATAEEYDLESINVGLKKQGLYQPSSMPDDLHDVLHISAKYEVGKEPREIYFFREGSAVFWNVPEIERQEVMLFLRNYETNSYEENLILEESEVMNYVYTDNKTRLVNGRILLNSEGSTDLEKYTFSNGMALSVKLALWESFLDQYGDSIEWITENMRLGKKINITKDQVFRKTGELYALRHHINLSSDLLDTPDFYWDRQHLEHLYHKICNYLNITKRTKVMNEKLSHCLELMELLSHHLSDNHHVRLEVMIIILILIEVAFEVIHYVEHFI